MSWTPQNRYASQPSGHLGLWVKILLGVSAAFGFINAIMLQSQVRSGAFSITVNPSGQTQAMQTTSISSPLASLAPLLSIATIVCWLMWQHRVTSNIWARGMRIGTSPGWAVGWWFVPVANLFMPAIAVQNVYRASTGGRKHTGWIVAGWWLAWMAPTLGVIPVVFAKILTPLVDGLNKASNSQVATTIDLSSAMHAVAPWFLAVAICQAVSAALAIMIVSGIDKAQATAEPVADQMPGRPDLGF